VNKKCIITEKQTRKGFPNQRVVDNSIQGKGRRQRMKKKCTNFLTFKVKERGEKILKFPAMNTEG